MGKVIGGSDRLTDAEREANESGKFLWNLFIYSTKWITYTPKGETADEQNELIRLNK